MDPAIPCTIIDEGDIDLKLINATCILFPAKKDPKLAEGIATIECSSHAKHPVCFASLPRNFLRVDPVDKNFLYVPKWMGNMYKIESGDQVVLHVHHQDAVPAESVVVELFEAHPAFETIVNALTQLLQKSKKPYRSGYVAPFILSGHRVLARIVSNAEGSFVINEQTVIEFEHQGSQLPECLPNIFQKDAERMLLSIQASRLTLKDAEDENQPAAVHFVGPIDFSGRDYFLSAIHRALGFALDPLEVDLHRYAYDEEIEEDRDLAKVTESIVKTLEETLAKGARLLYLCDVTRFTLPEVQNEIFTLIGRLAISFGDCVILLLDTNKPPKQLVSRLQSHKVVLEQFQPAPLDHQQRKIYLKEHTDFGDAELDAFKWTLGGFELMDLERVCIEFQFLRSAAANAVPFDVLHRAIETAKKEDDSRGKHLQMLSRGLCSWPEIKGYDALKAKLQNHLYGPLKKPELYGRYGVALPSGILLHGPSGCGKSMAIQAIANDGVFSVLEIRLEHLLSKYFGETEERLRDAFRMARQAAPCILFVDGIEGLGQRRGIGEESSADTTGVSERLLSTLLNEMDGIEGIRGVIVVGTTTSPELLDSALLRPGRLDLHLGFALPTADDRLALIVSWASRFSLSLAEDQLNALGTQTEGLSCADIVHIFQQVGRDAIHRDPSDPLISIADLLDRFNCE